MQSFPTMIDPMATGLLFHNDALVVIDTQEGIALADSATITLLTSSFMRCYYLGIINNHPCYCAELPSPELLPTHAKLLPLRHAFETLSNDWYGTIAKAYSIITWDKNHHFCGRCGALTTVIVGSFERICTTCDLFFYPRISPSILVLIKKDDQLLMARSPHFKPGVYGLIAGFIEVGETVEEAVHREVKEEVNIDITNLKYFGSQSWPFPDSLMLGFFADYVSGEIIPDPKEIEVAGWYHYDNLPGLPSSSLNLGRKLINAFITQQELIHKES